MDTPREGRRASMTGQRAESNVDTPREERKEPRWTRNATDGGPHDNGARGTGVGREALQGERLGLLMIHSARFL